MNDHSISTSQYPLFSEAVIWINYFSVQSLEFYWNTSWRIVFEVVCGYHWICSEMNYAALVIYVDHYRPVTSIEQTYYSFFSKNNLWTSSLLIYWQERDILLKNYFIISSHIFEYFVVMVQKPIDDDVL